MPNRYIRDGFLDSEAVHNLSDAAECFYHRLLLAADDAGRFDGRADILRSRLFPLDSSRRASDVDAQLRECITQGLVTRYEVSGKPYLQVAKWAKCGKSALAKYPSPAGDFAISYVHVENKDGKEFVTTSIISTPHGVGTPCRPHTDGVPPKSYVDVDGNDDVDENENALSRSARKRAPASPKPPRQRNELFDAVAAMWGLDAKVHGSRIGKVAADFKALGATPDDIKTRRARMTGLWGAKADTPESLVKHWPTFALQLPSELDALPKGTMTEDEILRLTADDRD